MPHPQNWTLATPALSDAATITASGAQTETPVSNLQRRKPTAVWSAASVTPWLKFDLGSAKRMNQMAALYANAPQSAVWRVRTAETDGGLTSGPAFDTGAALSLGAAALTQASQTSASFDVAAWLFEACIRLRATPGAGFRFAGYLSTSPSDLLEIWTATDRTIRIARPGAGSITIGSFTHDHQWVTVSVSYSAGTLFYYIDGQVVATDSVDLSSMNFDAIHIGLTTPPECDLRFVRLWNSPRTHEQVLADHDKQLTSSVTGLLANYRFNDSLANSGSVGGTLGTVTGTAVYRPAMRFWPSEGLGDYPKKHGLLWVPDSGIKGGAGVPAYLENRWVRWDFDFTGAPGSITSLGRPFLSLAHQFEWNPDYGSEPWVFEDAARSRTLAGGQRSITPSAPILGCRLPFQTDNLDDLDAFFEIVRVNGASGDLLAVLDPTNADGKLHRRIIHGTLPNRVAIAAPEYGAYRSQIEIHGLA